MGDGDSPEQMPEAAYEVTSDQADTSSTPAGDGGVVAPVAPPATPALSFVYALGQIEPRFPSLSIEKEFAQAVSSAANAGLTDRQALKRAISERQNRYLVRSLCWVFTVEGLETYILVPRDPADLDLLVDAYRDEPRDDDLDAVIGVRSHIAPPEMCNGLTLPVVVFDQLYSFDRETLIDSIPLPDSVSERNQKKFRSAASSLFHELSQLADNVGALDEHRALNYLTVRYPRIYTTTTEQFDKNFSFDGVEVVHSDLSDVRSIVDVVFSYTHRETDFTERQYVRVDVTEEFPFLVSAIGPYYGR